MHEPLNPEDLSQSPSPFDSEHLDQRIIRALETAPQPQIRADFAARVADATIAKVRPDASVTTLRANDPALYALRDSWLDAAAVHHHRFHGLGNAVPFNLRRPILRHEADNDSADHRNYDHPRAELIICGAAKMEGPFMVERKIREESNQIVEKKSHDSRNDAHEPGQQ